MAVLRHPRWPPTPLQLIVYTLSIATCSTDQLMIALVSRFYSPSLRDWFLELWTLCIDSKVQLPSAYFTYKQAIQLCHQMQIPKFGRESGSLLIKSTP